MNTQHICPSCQKPLAEGSPQGLCPECLMKAGFGSAAGRPGGNPKFLPPSVADLARLFPQLEILELIGQGGMGAVYRARQPGLDRLVAVKILPPESTAESGFAERFSREARALARLNHPNIVSVYDFGQADGLHYFIMEYVDGLNLRQLAQSGRLSAREALQIVPQMCDALQFAHDEGIVHRDIKPENVMIDKRGRVKITDFGLAKLLGHEPENLQLTGARDVMGTPHYMAPEQIDQPQTVDHRADIYSLGVVFYELLTGELPIGKFAPPSKKVSVDVRLDEVVLHTLEREPGRRYQHASQVKTDVETIAQTSTPMAAPPVASARTPEESRMDEALRQVGGPGAGLLVTAILNWVAIPLLALVGAYISRGQGRPSLMMIWLPLMALVVSSFVFVSGLLMRRLRGYWLAVAGSILAILVTPGNIIGLPIGIWCLVVLSQKRVREAFGREVPVGLHRAAPAGGGGWKVAAVIVGAILLLLAVPAGLMVAAIALPALSRAKAAAIAQRERAEADSRAAELRLAQERSAGYGPAQEVRLNAFSPIDLETGRILEVPEEVKSGADPQTAQWLANEGADLMFRRLPGTWGLLTTEANELNLMPVPDDAWVNNHVPPKLAVMRMVFSQTIRTNGSLAFLVDTNAAPPFTFSFRTGSGTSGLLRIKGFGDDPDHARIAYKLKQ